jgi:hypothetical protein
VFSRLTRILAAGEPNPNLSKGMADEHCVMYGHDEPFETSNYSVRTTPRQEYEITTGKRGCAAKDMLDNIGRQVRIIRSIDELKLLKVVQKAGLVEEELIAVVRARHDMDTRVAYEFNTLPADQKTMHFRLTFAIFPICNEVDAIVIVAVDLCCPVRLAGALHRAHVPGACPAAHPSPTLVMVTC